MGGHDEPPDDAFQLWIYAQNCYLNDGIGTPEGTAEQQRQIMERRTRQEQLYAPIVLRDLNADPARLEAAITECRAHSGSAEQNARRDDGYAEAVQLGTVALALLRAAGADRPAARARLVRKLDAQITGPVTPRWRTRLATSRANSRWLRKPRRLTLLWRRQRRVLAVNLHLQRTAPSSVGALTVIVADLGADPVGRIGFATCPDCRRGLVYKVESYPPYDGIGLGTALVDAAVAEGPPGDGYTWHTTAQYTEAVGFWRAMRRRHRTPFTAAGTAAACPHMTIGHSRNW